MEQEREHETGAGGAQPPPFEPPPDAPPPPPEPAAAPVVVAPVVVPRWIQAVVLPLALLGAYALLRAAGPVALIFIVAAIVALLLDPFVALLQRGGFPRGLAVLCTYLVLILGLAALGAVLAEPVGD